MTQWKVGNYVLLKASIILMQSPSCDTPYTNAQQSKLSIVDGSGLDDKRVKASLKLGLFSYPVLQAADILVHR